MKPGRIKKVFEIILVVGILGLVGDLLLPPLIGRYYIAHRFTPHEKTATIQQLEKDFGVKLEVRHVTTKGRDYILATAPLMRWATPSGPPMYVFDSEGRLLDYTLDSGDDPRFMEKWCPKDKD
jgi:hypothetical protein